MKKRGMVCCIIVFLLVFIAVCLCEYLPGVYLWRKAYIPISVVGSLRTVKREEYGWRKLRLLWLMDYDDSIEDKLIHRLVDRMKEKKNSADNSSEKVNTQLLLNTVSIYFDESSFSLNEITDFLDNDACNWVYCEENLGNSLIIVDPINSRLFYFYASN